MKIETPDLGVILDAAKRVLKTNYNPAVDREVRIIGKALRRSLRRYGSAGREGKIELARGREYLLAQSPAAKIASYLLGYPKTKSGGLTWANVRQQALAVDPRRVSTDVLRASVKTKPDGGERTTCSGSPARRAQVELAKNLILARVGYSPFEYVRKGRGRDAAAAAGLHAIDHHGVRWLSLTDVKSFFASCRREMAYAVLPISRKLIDNAVFVPKGTPIKFLDTLHSYDHTTLENAVRLGLIEGSQVSGLVAQKIIEACLAAVPSPLIVCHGDNVMIGASSKSDCLAKTNAFASLLEKHPGGPLQLKESTNAKVGDPTMDFCGYRLLRRKWLGVTSARAKPSLKAFARFDRRLFVRLFTADTHNEELIISSYTDRWSRSFKLWLGRPQGQGLAEIAAALTVAPLVWQALADVKKEGLSFPTKAAREAYANTLALALIPSSVSWQFK